MKSTILSMLAGVLIALTSVSASAQSMFGTIPAKSEEAMRRSNAIFAKIDKTDPADKDLFAQWDEAAEKDALRVMPAIEAEIATLEKQQINFQNGGFGFNPGEYPVTEVNIDGMEYPFIDQKKAGVNKSGCHVVGDYNPIGVGINFSVWVEGVKKNVVGMQHVYCLITDNDGNVVDCCDGWLGRVRSADGTKTKGTFVLKSPESPELANRYTRMVFVDQDTFKEWQPKVEALHKAAADKYFKK